jgi:hypothetical protein
MGAEMISKTSATNLSKAVLKKRGACFYLQGRGFALQHFALEGAATACFADVG